MPKQRKNVYDLPKPFFVLAPMDDVTDTVFRQIVAECAPPDLYFTEFVNVDGLQSPGREKLLQKLAFTPKEQLLIAQIWGKNPDNYYKTVKELKEGTIQLEIDEMRKRAGLDRDAVQGRGDSTEQGVQKVQRASTGVSDEVMRSKPVSAASSAGRQDRAVQTFAGVDINMGCPDKAVLKIGCCAALADNRELAGEIIDAVKEAAGEDFPVSVKTRLGNKFIDMSWPEFLLTKKLNMLTIHGRTAKEMSKVPVHWDKINEIRKLRDHLSPTTLFVGNGDVVDREEGEELAKKYKLDGVMIGRGVFHDPFVFAQKSPWQSFSTTQKIDLYKKHVELYAKLRPDADRKIATLGKFCKIYVQGFEGAKEMREKLMKAKSTTELLTLLK